MSNTMTPSTPEEDENEVERSALQAAFMDAAWYGNTAEIQRCIDLGAEIDLPEERKSRDKITALIAAAQSGHLGVVDALIRAGANMDWRDWGGHFALEHAAACGHELVVAMLCDAGADMEQTEGQACRNALEVALNNGRPKVVKALLDRGLLPGVNGTNQLIQGVIHGWTYPQISGAWNNVNPFYRDEPEAIAMRYKACFEILLPWGDMLWLSQCPASNQACSDPAPVNDPNWKAFKAMVKKASKEQALSAIQACRESSGPLSAVALDVAQRALRFAASRGDVRTVKALIPFVDPKCAPNLMLAPTPLMVRRPTRCLAFNSPSHTNAI